MKIAGVTREIKEREIDQKGTTVRQGVDVSKTDRSSSPFQQMNDGYGEHTMSALGSRWHNMSAARMMSSNTYRAKNKAPHQ